MKIPNTSEIKTGLSGATISENESRKQEGTGNASKGRISGESSPLEIHL